MKNTVKAISTLQLDRLCQQPYSAASYSPLAGHLLFLLDLSTIDSTLPAYQHGPLSKILPHIPCPVIAIAPAGAHKAITDSVDVVVSSHKEAQGLLDNILQCPLTAMTLVQLLRHNEKSGTQDGLLAESLAYATLQAGKEFKNYLAARAEPPQPPKNPEPPVLVQREEDTLVLTINRPQQYNAYSTEVRDALFEGLMLQAEDDSIRKTIIRSNGPCFCTGGALHEFGQVDDVAMAHAIRSTRNVGRLIAALSDKVECQLHRACIGSGIELPAFASHIIAAPNTFFQLPEITMGLIPGAGGTVSILKRIGRQRMSYWALSAKKIKAATALEWGLIDIIE
ncbi:MAG: enoyl-CoA hydratase/isomerase family protein [Proteobacteria bacterium]|nr:enoyl-CoA hydratase/isomerase family protein [Pseudomonadota bacterium]